MPNERTIPKVSDKINGYGSYEILWSELIDGEWRSKRKSTKTGDREQAAISLANFIATRDIASQKTCPRIKTVAAAYLKIHCHPRNMSRTQGSALRAPLEAFGDMYADTINDSDIDAYTRRRRAGAHGHKPVKDATIRREINTLQAALNFGSRKSMIPRGPKYLFTKPTDGPSRDLWLTEGQELEVYSALHQASPSVRLFFRMGMTYAVRKGAMLDLKYKDQVSFITNTINFNVPGRRITRKKRAAVPMTTEVREEIEAAFRLCNGKGHVLDHSTGYDYVKFMKRIGYDWVTPHVLKHSAITLMLRAGEKIEDVAELTQTDIRTILKHYRHHTIEELTKTAGSRRT